MCHPLSQMFQTLWPKGHAQSLHTQDSHCRRLETRAVFSVLGLGLPQPQALRAGEHTGVTEARVHVPTSQFLPHPNITFIDVYKSSHLHKHIYFKRKLYITARNEKPGSLCH